MMCMYAYIGKYKLAETSEQREISHYFMHGAGTATNSGGVAKVTHVSMQYIGESGASPHPPTLPGMPWLVFCISSNIHV